MLDVSGLAFRLLSALAIGLPRAPNTGNVLSKLGWPPTKPFGNG